MKKNLLLKIVAVALVAIAFISCKQEVQPTGVKLNQTSLALETGSSASLIATVEPAGAVGSVAWSSSNDAVASVTDGVVTAKSAGSATITAKISTFSATCSVTVTDPYVKVTSVILSQTSLELVEGDVAQLTATVAPDNATDKTVSWKSSDTKVATVSATGEVVAVAEGSATITATAGDVSSTCAVAVAKKVIDVESVTLDVTALELTEGESATLTATVAPDNATDKAVAWSSDNTGVATVEGGVVTAVAEGTATITAKAGDKSATCKVTVKKKVIAVESVALDVEALELTEGESATLAATVLPENATDKTVTWSSSDVAVATVEGGVVTAVAEGTATVTAKAGEKTATCSVTVKKKVVAVESVTLDRASLELSVGGTATLTATVLPENATDKTVAWSSSDVAVATVEGGVVTAVAEGTATVTAKAGEKTATCSVTVKKDVVEVTGVTINEADFTLSVGETKALTATVKPDDATDKTVTWSSSDVAVATVSADGLVTAVAAGTAVITVKAGNVSDFVNVTVEGGESSMFEEWFGTWAARSGLTKYTLEVEGIETSDGSLLEDWYFIYGWEKLSIPFVGWCLDDGSLAFVGGDAMLIIEDKQLWDDDPQHYDLFMAGFFKYTDGKSYFLTDDDPYVVASGELSDGKATLNPWSFELGGDTYKFSTMRFLLYGHDEDTYYSISSGTPGNFPYTLTKSSSAPAMVPSAALKANGAPAMVPSAAGKANGAPAMVPSAALKASGKSAKAIFSELKAMGLKLEKEPIEVRPFKRTR